MRNARLIKLLALLAALLALCGCAASHAEQAGLAANVGSLLDAREKGVNSADGQAYLSTVLPGDTVLLKEESNLIRAAGGLGIKDYTVTAGAVSPQGDGCTALLTQTYTVGGETRKCAFRAVFALENGKLYYDGPDFRLKQGGGVKVYYTPDREGLAGQVLGAEAAVLKNMKDELGFVPEGFISVKLFEDQQVFLQSIKLDLPAWVGGWHEFGESIKTYTGAYGTDIDAYKPMLSHESTHRMVSELSNDNASYWLQEGLASVYQDELGHPDREMLPADEASAVFSTYAEQKKIDLEKIGADDQAAVEKYYGTSKAFAAFLLENYGWDKVKAALEYMKKFDLIPVTGDEKIQQTNDRTDEALKAVFGFAGDSAFQAEFEKWLANKK